MQEEQEKQVAERPRNGSVTFYHANGKGTGVAARLELRMNRPGEQTYDCFFLEMAHQKETPSMRGSEKRPATFDWANKATVKLSFNDVCELLTVLEGHKEQAGNGRNGLYHQTGETNTLIAFKNSTESNGYLLSVSRRSRSGQNLFKGHVLLNEAEATGLRCLFQTSLFFMVFHASISA